MGFGMSVLIRIQHAAGRDLPLARLLAQLPPAVEVITDEQAPGDPNPWRGYQLCLSNPPYDGHLCVLQDDVHVCHNFAPALDRIAAANPDTPVCLFLGGVPRRTANLVRQALRGNQHYVDLARGDFMPVVATLWPVLVASQFMHWVTANKLRLPRHGEVRSDDAVAGRWLRFNSQRVRICVPSLVQHPDDVPSTIGKRAGAGSNSSRVAVHWIGADDPLAIDWSAVRQSRHRIG
jgi:hypothetical protein